MARPKAAGIVADISPFVEITTTKPQEGGRRIVLAFVDDAGNVKMADWEMNAQAFRHLPERYSWEQHFYPAILKLMQ